MVGELEAAADVHTTQEQNVALFVTVLVVAAMMGIFSVVLTTYVCCSKCCSKAQGGSSATTKRSVHQGHRVAAGLESLSAAPVNSVAGLFARDVQKPAPAFMAAMQTIADAGIIPRVRDMAETTLETARDQKRFGNLKNDPLTEDGIAFIMKYTAEDSQPTIYADMNSKAYDSDRSKIIPYGAFMVGMVKHMKQIEAYGNHTVYRGVKSDLRSDYPEGRRVTWHGFSSTTKTLKVLENPLFCGTTGKRTIFAIKLTQGQAREISRYSLVGSEDEVLLPPGCRFVVESSLPQGDLTLIQLREIESKEWIEDIRIGIKQQPEYGQTVAPSGQAISVPLSLTLSLSVSDSLSF